MKKIILLVVGIILLTIGFYLYLNSESNNTDLYLQRYTQGYMDLNYKNEKELYKEITDMPDDELNIAYSNSLDVEVSYFIEFFELKDITNEEKEEIKDLLDKVYQKSKYVVGIGKMIDDNNFEVEVIISPINIIKLIEEELINRIQTDSIDELATLEEGWNGIVIELLRNNIDNIDYLDDEKVIVEITYNNTIYEFKEESLNNIDKKIIKYDYNEI